MAEFGKTEILICPTHGPMSNRDARRYIDQFGIAISVCPDCGRTLEFVDSLAYFSIKTGDNSNAVS